jgi:hypothetical protein
VLEEACLPGSTRLVFAVKFGNKVGHDDIASYSLHKEGAS